MKENMMILICLAIILTGGAARAEILGDYVGYTACIACHQEIADGWKTTPHADAFATLKKQGEEKQLIAGCVKCHVTAFGQDGGFIDMALTPELKGVQCEACHGPARLHVVSGGDPGEVILNSPDVNSCRTCHTEGQDKKFNFEIKKQFVHGGGSAPPALPAVVKKQDGRLWADTEKIDFGNMVEGVVAKRVVLLKNAGDAPLKITNVTTS